ncbi:MAG TPA: hypothetical protein O0X50_00255 [Methanocorpusculum sp.]|nr:hypothetical protein [Methanocorpusculum sp.]
MTLPSISRTRQEIIDTPCVHETFDAHEILMVKRLLRSFDPDAIITMTETGLPTAMTVTGTLPATQSRITTKTRLRHIRRFQTFLNREFAAGRHLDTWFEPEYLEKRI